MAPCLLFLGLEAGIFVAIAASIGFFVARASKVNFAVTREGNRERIVVDGNLFYASVDQLAKHLRNNPKAETVLDLSRVPYCDATAKEMIRKAQAERAIHGGQIELVAST